MACKRPPKSASTSSARTDVVFDLSALPRVRFDSSASSARTVIRLDPVLTTRMCFDPSASSGQASSARTVIRLDPVLTTRMCFDSSASSGQAGSARTVGNEFRLQAGVLLLRKQSCRPQPFDRETGLPLAADRCAAATTRTASCACASLTTGSLPVRTQSTKCLTSWKMAPM